VAGDRVIVAFRGSDGVLHFASYEPNRWTRITDPPVELQAPLTDSPTFAWTGARVLVWAYENHAPGNTSGGNHRLLSYDPARRRWDRLADPPVSGLIDAHPVWTGSELLIWGGPAGATGTWGGAYDPATNTWHDIAAAPMTAREDPTVVWTGTEMIVWAG